jgi:hypothetical protein
MDRDKIAEELVKIAKSLVASEDVRAAKELLEALEFYNIKNEDSTATDFHYKKAVKAIMDHLGKGWLGQMANTRGILSLMDDLDDFIHNQETWDEFGASLSEVKLLTRKLNLYQR